MYVFVFMLYLLRKDTGAMNAKTPKRGTRVGV